MKQSEVIDFLMKPQSYGLDETQPIQRYDTHISVIFIAGDYAYKLKRAIALPFVDFSRLEDREKFCRLELKINQINSPHLYLDVVPICEKEGLHLGGQGEVVDWLVKMKCFDQSQLFDQLCENGQLHIADMESLSDHIVECYQDYQRNDEYGGAAGMVRAFDGHYKAFENCPEHVLDQALLDDLKKQVAGEMTRHTEGLNARQKNGYVRHCHGDLHLRNICFFEGQITLFDAIEFEPDYAVIDILYDLSFLLMDLCHRKRLDLANCVMNRYLGRTGDVAGLKLLGLFLSSRSAIRTHVNAVASQNQPSAALRLAWEEDARCYLKESLGYLEAQPVMLVAIGGLSGSGKSTLAKALAPTLGKQPGAFIARTDMIRKRLMQVAPFEKLPKSAYQLDVTQKTYETLYQETRVAIESGYCVIIDGVFAKEEERQKLSELATELGIPFAGLWLEVDQKVLENRVRGRKNDPSDADVQVVRLQAGYKLGAIDWHRLDASTDLGHLTEKAHKILTDVWKSLKNQGMLNR
ncbi:bifunctional aminoglycoside phosphotransferase/ATP-binding protein [Terasakiella sp. SH-1]|uniref:bifunctional aminoglycoside phosphotransferase/ATP-binding protein n=1 Tax=Terasakiella sp. SH-1 TaxID=2560057 RepID=UPI00107488D9|nr:bifunctional aminoglycoside phosphotransferase/ATP-binding protein [Terasakiella sp. SH-1]